MESRTVGRAVTRPRSHGRRPTARYGASVSPARVAAAREFVTGNPGCSITDVRSHLQVSPRVAWGAVRDAGVADLVVREGQTRTGYTADQMGAALRRASDDLRGEYLGVADYTAWQANHGGPSAVSIITRFGQWSIACARAGVPARSADRRSVYTRDQVIAAVAEFILSGPGRATAEQYLQWARIEPGRPSLQLVKNRCGTWARAKQEALGSARQRSPVGADRSQLYRPVLELAAHVPDHEMPDLVRDLTDRLTREQRDALASHLTGTGVVPRQRTAPPD